MRCAMPLSMLLSLSILGLVSMTYANDAAAEVTCSGHKLLPIPRPQSSCSNVKPEIYPSPDGALRALVFPVGVSLYATPCMPSRVVVGSTKCDPLSSQASSSPGGATGYYAFNSHWPPDSQFFVYGMSSSGGHSPWSFPMMVYSRHKNRIAGFSDMINGEPTVSGDFHFAGPHTVGASTWKQPGSLDDKVAVTVDLE